MARHWLAQNEVEHLRVTYRFRFDGKTNTLKVYRVKDSLESGSVRFLAENREKYYPYPEGLKTKELSFFVREYKSRTKSKRSKGPKKGISCSQR